jgi:hypothetical protein
MHADFDRIKRLVADMEADFPKFYTHKNQSAGIRIRRNMQKVRELAQKIRLDVLSRTKGRAYRSK